jgi:hypothetical protein
MIDDALPVSRCHLSGPWDRGVATTALIYQHEAPGADKRITGAIDAHFQSEQADDDDDGTAGGLLPVS